MAFIAGGVSAVALGVWHASAWLAVRNLEGPNYTVVKELRGKNGCQVELRHYEPYLVAQVTLDDMELEKFRSSGFKQIAGFIFGDNTSVRDSSKAEKVAMTSPVIVDTRADTPAGAAKQPSEKVAMTSPVIMSEGPEGLQRRRRTMQFVMPSKYTRETLPKPNNPNVQIREVAGHDVAASTWRGRLPNEKKVASRKAELLEVLSQHSIQAEDPNSATTFGYYPPFAPPWLQKHEVIMRVKGTGFGVVKRQE